MRAEADVRGSAAQTHRARSRRFDTPTAARDLTRAERPVFEVSYKLKPEWVAQNDGLVVSVFESLKQARPALPAFKAFTAGIQERCELPPHWVDLKEIGSDGFFGT